MQEAFLIIISIIGAGYAIWTKQPKLSLGLLVIAGSFALAIPGLSSGVKADILGGASMVVFAAGILLIVYKKEKNEEENKEEKKVEKASAPKD